VGVDVIEGVGVTVGVSEGVAPTVREAVGLGVWLGVFVGVGVDVLEMEDPREGVWLGVCVAVGVEEDVGDGEGPARRLNEEDVPVYVSPLWPITVSLALYVVNVEGEKVAGSV